MEHRDLIKDEIERLGQNLGRILAQILRTEGAHNSNWQFTQNALSELDLGELLELPDLDTQLAAPAWSDANLDRLAEVLFHSAEKESIPKREQLLQRSLELYDLANSRSSTWSMERNAAMQRIQQMLD